MRTKKNLKKHELIGLVAEVLENRNPAQIGIKGKVVDETKNILKIESGKKEKSIVKRESVFMFTLPTGEKSKVRGNEIDFRPEERIRKAWIKGEK